MYKITILGCGSSSGVPALEFGFGKCNPNNHKNIRTRSSILVEIDGFNILIDTSPDLKQQCLQNNVKRIDCIFYTHFHSDHIAGVFDIRGFCRLQKQIIPYYLNQATFESVKSSFGFAFQESNEAHLANIHRPLLSPTIIKNNEIFTVNDGKIIVKPLFHPHGKIEVVGYKFNNTFAYITDISSFPEKLIKEYCNLDLIIMSACTHNDHPSHMRFDNVVNLLQNHLKPKQAYLTHLGGLLDYEIENNKLFKSGINNISLGYDGQIIIC